MSFYGSGRSGKVTENDLPQSVKEKLNELEELKQTVENLDPSLAGRDIDLGTF